ncbi:MAG: hypothetical protein V3R96_05440 [Dehalococcoidales bacterium]
MMTLRATDFIGEKQSTWGKVCPRPPRLPRRPDKPGLLAMTGG